MGWSGLGIVGLWSGNIFIERFWRFWKEDTGRDKMIFIRLRTQVEFELRVLLIFIYDR